MTGSRRRTAGVAALLLLGVVWMDVPGRPAPPGSDPRVAAPGTVWATAALPYTVAVPPDGGRPGLAFDSPGPALAPPSEVVAGGRNDATVFITSAGDGFLVTLQGPAGEGDPMAAARASADRWPDSGLGEVIHGPRPVVNGLGDTVRVDLEAGLRVLSEWYVVHDGYLYAVGVLRDPETPEVEGIAQQMIDSWRWTSAGT